MASFRTRDGKTQAIVRVKQHGVLIFNEAKTFDSPTLAKDWARRLEARVKTSGPLASRSSTTTFSALIDLYRKARSEVKPLGRAIRGDLDMLESRLGAMQLSALTSNTWSDFARKRRAEGAGPATVMHNMAVARTVLAGAKAMFGMPVDATPISESMKALTNSGHVAKSRQRTRRPTAEELSGLDVEFRRIYAHPQSVIRMFDVLALAVAFPRRCGELCRMQWEDYSGGIMTLYETKDPRTPRTEIVPVPPVAQKLMEDMARVDARVLPYNSESVSSAFDRACERLGIKDLHFHDLRHEGICRLFESGLQIQEVAMISGHTSWATLKRYTHLRPQDVLERMRAHT